MREHITVVENEAFFDAFSYFVFEAEQGLLLDQNNRAYFPHLTPSNTGIKNARKVIERISWKEPVNIETCYVSRTYLTRHGAGKFPMECAKDQINAQMSDRTNMPNPYQGSLRYGMLDLRELKERCQSTVTNTVAIGSFWKTYFRAGRFISQMGRHAKISGYTNLGQTEKKQRSQSEVKW